MKTSATSFISVCWTLIEVKRLLYTADEKRYLAVYIYYNNCISMFCVLWKTGYSEYRVL
ncbi:unnamed protein product, partial [Staurois parvus]